MSRVWKFGADVDTDQIVPGRYAPYMRPDEDVGRFAFIEARPEFARAAQPGDVIVAGPNFGCGSSREYAPEALKRRGIGAIIAPSFARIFFRNAINLGIPLFASEAIPGAVDDGEEVTLDLIGGRLITARGELPLPPLPRFVTDILEAGGIVAYVRAHGRFPGTSACRSVLCGDQPNGDEEEGDPCEPLPLERTRRHAEPAVLVDEESGAELPRERGHEGGRNADPRDGRNKRGDDDQAEYAAGELPPRGASDIG